MLWLENFLRQSIGRKAIFTLLNLTMFPSCICLRCALDSRESAFKTFYHIMSVDQRIAVHYPDCRAAPIYYRITWSPYRYIIQRSLPQHADPLFQWQFYFRHRHKVYLRLTFILITQYMFGIDDALAHLALQSVSRSLSLVDWWQTEGVGDGTVRKSVGEFL